MKSSRTDKVLDLKWPHSERANNLVKSFENLFVFKGQGPYTSDPINQTLHSGATQDSIRLAFQPLSVVLLQFTQPLSPAEPSDKLCCIKKFHNNLFPGHRLCFTMAHYTHMNRISELGAGQRGNFVRPSVLDSKCRFHCVSHVNETKFRIVTNIPHRVGKPAATT